MYFISSGLQEKDADSLDSLLTSTLNFVQFVIIPFNNYKGYSYDPVGLIGIVILFFTLLIAYNSSLEQASSSEADLGVVIVPFTSHSKCMITPYGMCDYCL